jgi:pimeloyl-ACP methyl ester carboxylesterase
LILLHGLAGDATLWLRHGQAAALAAAGHRVVLPDFRGHGGSARPRDAAAYPRDVLTDDALALVEHLAPADYDLGGYSLGARIAVRMLVRGAAPARAVVAGQGLHQILGRGGGAGDRLRRALTGAPDERTARWLRESGDDPVALLHVLDSLAPTEAEALARIAVPTLVVAGAEDERAAAADDLAAALPHATRVTVPGNHATAPAAPQLTAVIAAFLA